MSCPRTYILQAGGVDVEVERKAVRRMNLRVVAKGRVRMSVPWRVGKAEAAAFLASHEAWLVEALAQVEARRAADAARHADGQVPLWGKLVTCDSLPEELWRAELEARLPQMIAATEAALGVHASGWQLRDMKTRWGSCTPKTARIRINIRLAAYPATCLDYVVAHELAHLLEPSHNQRFHQIVAQAYPNEAQARAILRRNPWDVAQGA